MRILQETDLQQQLAKGKLSPVYLLWGNEPYLARHYVKKISALATDGENESFNLNFFENQTPLQEIYNAVNQLPFLCKKRCVCVRDFDFEHATNAAFSAMCELLADVSETTVLVLWYDLLELECNPKRLPARLKKLLEACEAGGGSGVLLLHRQQQALIKMLCDGAARRGVKMEPTSARYMIENVSNDLTTLLSELEKLCAYASDGIVTNDVIDRVCVRSVEASVYTLSKALIAGNLTRALEILQDLYFLKTKPEAIRMTLAGAFIDLYRARAAVQAGRRADSIAQEFGYKNNAFALTNAVRDAKGISDLQLEACLDALLDSDRQIKSSACDERALLEQLLVTLWRILAKEAAV